MGGEQASDGQVPERGVVEHVHLAGAVEAHELQGKVLVTELLNRNSSVSAKA